MSPLKYRSATPHAERRRRQRRNPARAASGKHLAPYIHRKKIQPIDIHIDIAQEFVEVVRLDAIRKTSEVGLGVDRNAHLRHHVELAPTHRVQVGTRLPVEVVHSEFIEVGDVELRDAKPQQGQQMRAADTA